MIKLEYLEWAGGLTAILYSLLISLNVGAEVLSFLLLFLSALLIGAWAHLSRHKGILFLQVFYGTAGIIGMIRWY